MKIVIFGASGRTGKLLVSMCIQAGHHVVAYVRNQDSIVKKHENLHIVVGQLNEIDKLRNAISGADACISTLGGSSLTKPTLEFTQGVRNVIQVMEDEKVNRFVYMSSLGVGESSAPSLRHGTRNEAIKGNLRVSRLDVAKFLLEQVTDNQFSKKSVWLIV